MLERLLWMFTRVIPLIGIAFSVLLGILYKIQNNILYLPVMGNLKQSPKDNPE